MREKDQMLHFRVSKAELDMIRQKMQDTGVRNMGAFLRKMALDGYCIFRFRQVTFCSIAPPCQVLSPVT